MNPTLEIGRKFNELTAQEYPQYIEQHEKYKDFNTLGLYRSIIENEKLSLAEKLEVRDFAHRYFQKTFDFLQLKDPATYFAVTTLGQSLTMADELQAWRDIIAGQEKIIKDKKLDHRNFGVYSKHACGDPGCAYNGVMVHKDSIISDGSNTTFPSDNGHYLHDKRWYAKNEKRKERKRGGNDDFRRLRDDD